MRPDGDVFDFNQFSKIRGDATKDEMSDHTPTWAVVATVDEPPALVQAFVAWHLSLGADAIFLYFDRPDDPAIKLFAGMPQVSIICCDIAHWLRVGKSRPRRHQVRQVRNARDAYAQTQADWLLHIDADEFLWPGTAIAGQLAAVAHDVDSVIVPVAERVFLSDETGPSVLSGAFRRPFRGPADEGRAVFGADFDFTYRGLTGHALGKAFVRSGRELNMSIHRAGMDDNGTPVTQRCTPDQIELLHFDGLTRQYWIYKLMRMARRLAVGGGMPPSPHRRKQADGVFANADGAGQLYDRLKVCDDARAALLRERGLLATPDFDPTAALAQFFPDQTIDLSPDAVDRWLGANKKKIMAFLHE
jgi:hypothetical protein